MTTASTARILIVDDDNHVREALVDELGEAYRVEAVGSAGEAMCVLATQQYDVVISDFKMPDHDGIEVLEFARAHQGDAVRVLLTGYLDERAQRALQRPDAPYKVGKPWHDEVEVTVRRGLEHREMTRRLSASVDDALRMTNIDEELAAARDQKELMEVVVRRAHAFEGVISCRVTTDGIGRGSGPILVREDGWMLDLPLDADGQMRLRAHGVGASARQLVCYLAHRAQRRCGVLEAHIPPVKKILGNGERTNQLMRQAAVGALSSALLHDLASTIQSLSFALSEVSDHADEGSTPLTKAIGDVEVAGDQVVQLFVQMRKFIRDGVVSVRPVPAARVTENVLKVVGGSVRERATLRCAAIPPPDVAIEVAEALFLQVLANLLRNAANASPAGGVVDLEIVVDEHEVSFVVTDDGPGVDPQIADKMFEPFASGSSTGTGLGLAISAYVMELIHGRVTYRKDATRGACFTAVVPRTRPK